MSRSAESRVVSLRDKAILLTTRRDTTEMEELLRALGADLLGVCYQKRPSPDPQLFLGRGRTEDARDLLRQSGARLVVVNGHLKPGQIFNLQQFFDDARGKGRAAAASGAGRVEVYDRTRLILEIFHERAQSPEARLQVELAQLTWEMPLVKEYIHLSKKGEHPGFLAGGEYEVNQYYDMMKKRMSRIRRELDRMRRERGLRRKHRRRGGFHLVSLAGYTNAGKSSLLRAMSTRDALVENRYFSTLSTKTARALSDRREILVTDTVGFIEDLPPWMVDAFHSTLEEIALADVIVLVLDASDSVPEMERRLRSSLRVLWEFDGTRQADEGRGGATHDVARRSSARLARGEPQLERDVSEVARGGTGRGELGAWRAGLAEGTSVGVSPMRRGLAPILVALNKIDQLPRAEVEAKRAALVADGWLDDDMVVAISARTGDGLPALFDKLYELIPDYDEYEVAIPPTPEGEVVIAWLHEHADVLDLTRGNESHVHFEAKRSLRVAVREQLALAHAVPLREVARRIGDEANDSSSEGPDVEAVDVSPEG